MAGIRANVSLICCLGFLCFSQAIAGYDFFVYPLLWPGGYCEYTAEPKCCVPTTGYPIKGFFVEGLQPYNSTTGEPVTDCNPACMFYVNALANLIGDLYKYWSNVSCPSNNGLDGWKSTWCTYGNCSAFNETTYFQKSLNLRANLTLLSRLKKYGITPSKHTFYSLSSIQAALYAEIGGPAVIECRKSSMKGKSDILRFKFCVATDGETLIDCPIDFSSNCEEKVRLYPFTYDMLRCDDENPIELSSAEHTAM